MMITIQNKTTTEIEEKGQKYLEYQRQYRATHKKEKQQYMKDNKEKLAEFVERASKHYGHVHTFHRSTSSIGFAGADGEFPVTRAATKLKHDYEETTKYTFPCFVAFSLSLFILVGLGSKLLDK